jgi:hypothetical protein
MNKFTSAKQELIYDFIRCAGPSTPTEIGIGLGKSYNSASSWACGSLKIMCKNKLLTRLKEGKYKIRGTS